MGTPRDRYARWQTVVKLNEFRNLSVPNLAAPMPAARVLAALWLMLAACLGCNLCPTRWEREHVHNPFPQLKRVAVLPFFNQSGEPTVDTELVAEKYYGALQQIPGFEVLPVGVAKAQWLRYSMEHGEPVNGEQFQELARYMGVEALVVGSVTDFSAYYPPRMAMTVHWYAANEGFHAIPPGYGLPWGTEREQQIPDRIVREAEFELARSQLATQSPIVGAENMEPPLPDHWPDPTDLIPDPPVPARPVVLTNHGPVMEHTRLYRGDDPDFTIRLAHYVETGDDARPGSWQGYLKRSDDFVHFCCHLHIMEMLESRGGRDQSDLILRWPLSRY